MSKFQCYLPADFRKCVVAFVIVILSSLVVVASDSESAELRTSHDVYAPVRLDGDLSHTSISVNWEIDLANADGNQNHFSMAKTGDNLYVCVDYFGEPHNGKLFLREYRLSDGNHRELDVELPDNLKSAGTRFHSITVDGDGNLIAVFVRRCQENILHPELVLCEIKLSQGVIELDVDNAVTILLSNITLAPLQDGADIYSPWAGSVQGFSGSFASRSFQFAMAFGWNEKRTTNKYAYLKIRYDGTAGYNQPASADVTPLDIEGDLYGNAAPDVAEFPADSELFMVTRAPDGVGGKCFTPKLYRNGTCCDEEIMGENNSDNCRGFYTFMHNGHELSAYAVHHDEKNGSAFNIVEWSKGHDSYVKLWEAPATAFKCDFSVSPIYPVYYRQLAIADNDNSPLARDNGGVSTNLYLCSPGSGIGSYTITTPEISTGIDVTGVSHTGLVQRGNRLFVRLSDEHLSEGLLVVMDLSGRIVKTVDMCALNEDGIDLSSLIAPGVYLVRFEACVLKVVVD